MQAAAPRGATRLRADLGGSWGGAAAQSSGTECAWCHENVIEAKRCAACKVGAQAASPARALWMIKAGPLRARWPCAHRVRMRVSRPPPTVLREAWLALPFAGVQAVSYCSRACQVEHWKQGGHKAECARLAAQQKGGKA